MRFWAVRRWYLFFLSRMAALLSTSPVCWQRRLRIRTASFPGIFATISGNKSSRFSLKRIFIPSKVSSETWGRDSSTSSFSGIVSRSRLPRIRLRHSPRLSSSHTSSRTVSFRSRSSLSVLGVEATSGSQPLLTFCPVSHSSP